MTRAAKLFIPKVPENIHVDALTEYFGTLTAGPAKIPEHIRFVFICFTNRCGSNFLAELLASSGTYLAAGENLNFDTVLEHVKRQSLASFQEYLQFLVPHTQSNGVCFIKTAVSQIELLGKTGILDQIIDRAAFILIERRDKLAQAISYALALKTNKFMVETADDHIAVEPAFPRQLIADALRGIAESYFHFDLFFGYNGIVPIHVFYEDIVADPVGVVSAMARDAGLGGLAIDIANVKLQKQSGAINQKWRELYLR